MLNDERIFIYDDGIFSFDESRKKREGHELGLKYEEYTS